MLTQSLAIIDYLDETHPEPPFLPADPLERAKVRALAQIIACDIHPLNNVGPLRYIKSTLGQEQSDDRCLVPPLDPATASRRSRRCCGRGPYAFGAQVTLADICLVPQVANARRFKVPLDRFPKIIAVDAACLKLPAFDKARPENQPDAESGIRRRGLFATACDERPPIVQGQNLAQRAPQRQRNPPS